MFSLANLFVQIQAKTDAVDSAFDKVEKRARSARDSVGGMTDYDLGGKISLGGGDIADEAAAMGLGVRSALGAAMAPMEAIATRLQVAFDHVGGAVVTLARRIDAQMKFKEVDSFIDKVKTGIPNAFRSAFGQASQYGNKLARTIVGAGQAGVKALAGLVGAGQRVLRLQHFMSSLGKPDTKTLTQLKGPDLTRGIAQAARLNSALGVVNKTAATTAEGFRRLGGEIALALGAFALVYKAVQFIKGGIAEASHLNETVNKTKEIFGAAAASVQANADAMAKAYGLQKRPIMDAAAQFGIFFQEAGKSAQASADMANQLTKLAADFTSFSDIPYDVMLEKLRSGLAGEVEPLRQVGIFLNEDAVAAEAVAQGFAKSAKEVDDNAKILARYSLILKSTAAAKASGDLARTADSTANQFRKAGGGLVNFAETIGEVLMPAVSAGVAAFNELLASTIEVFDNNRGMIEGWASYITEAINTVSLVVRNWPDIWAIAQLGVTEKIANIIEWAETIPANLQQIGNYVAGNWRQLITDAVNAVGAVFHNLGDNLGRFPFALKEFLSGRGFEFEWKPLLDGFEATAAQLPELIKPHLTDLSSEMAKVADRIAERERQRIESMKKAVAPRATPGAKAPKAKEDKREETGFAEFAFKLRHQQMEEREKRLEENTQALKQTGQAVGELGETIKKGVLARFGS